MPPNPFIFSSENCVNSQKCARNHPKLTGIDRMTCCWREWELEEMTATFEGTVGRFPDTVMLIFWQQ